MTPAVIRKRRCAVYTRKSTEDGLDQEFNSLDAQREACEAYIASQKSEGWLLVADRYDDGGYSGGNLERPALKRLMVDIESGKIDVVVVYKVDRLSRSMFDFLKLVESFERQGVTFVSVTQQFNNTTSMGRLTLNMLLSFAQFEREVIGERIRDKVSASRRKGMWMGGHPPLGYEVRERKLLVNEAEAELLRHIFERFVALGSATMLVKELAAQEYRTRRGRKFTKGDIYKLLNNRACLGLAVHKGTAYPGEHLPIMPQDLWDKVHAILATNGAVRRNRTRAQTPALLKGLIFGPNGRAMTPSHTRRRGRLYRYYVAMEAIKEGAGVCPVSRLPAAEIETAVISQIRALLNTPEIIVRTWQAVRQEDGAVRENEIRKELSTFDLLWDELFPVEQARIVQLLVERVEVNTDGAQIRLRTAGFKNLTGELGRRGQNERRAA